ncbi:MAG: LytTR family DNA-binding domain-containing protein [Wenzhouxiangellaceae bacterium]
MEIGTYMKNRRYWEALMWISFFTINWVANVGVVWLEMERHSSDQPIWEPMVWEGSSAIMFLLLIPLMLQVLRWFPLNREHWRRSLLAHLGMTVPFTLLHVTGMVAIRELVYAWMGRGYDFGPWDSELFYEYLKDFRSYAYFLAIVTLYRLIIRRWQGEAEFLSQGAEESEPQPVSDRFLVKKLGREFLVRVEDIDWVESAGNYVNLHVGKRVYPLRETMTAIESRLQPQGFLRVHRSNIVNLERVSELLPLDSGDASLRLQDNQEVAVSRRYRKQLRDALAGG